MQVCVIFCGAVLLLVPGSTSNSIMDIINTEKVERLLAQRRENTTREFEEERRLLLENTVNGELPPEDAEEGIMDEDTDDDAEHQQNALDGKNYFQKPKHRMMMKNGHKQNGQNLTGVPDASSVLTDLTGLGRMLKTDRTSYLVTKKEYLRKDWCKTELIVQKVREEGCITRNILNRFCYGQCNSFYIPKNPPKRKKIRRKGLQEDADDIHAFKSCGFCKPKKFSWIYVSLKCPGLTPPYRKKKVHRIKQCKCLAENVNM